MTQTLVLAAAAVDRRLAHRAVRVLTYMAGRCASDPGAYHRTKHSSVARAIGLDRGNVARDLGQLVDLGYLEQGPPDGRIASYRVAERPWASPQRSANCVVSRQSRSA